MASMEDIKTKVSILYTHNLLHFLDSCFTVRISYIVGAKFHLTYSRVHLDLLILANRL